MSQEERKRSAEKKTRKCFLVFMLQKYEVFLSRNPSFPHFFTHRLSYGQQQGTKRLKDEETKRLRDEGTKRLRDEEAKRQRGKDKNQENPLKSMAAAPLL
ncbi:MAG: hypothetical protein SPE13_08020 [Alloprevotella sp.]|nr:hypothetical protein [Alloprevotella sp.]